MIRMALSNNFVSSGWMIQKKYGVQNNFFVTTQGCNLLNSCAPCIISLGENVLSPKYMHVNAVAVRRDDILHKISIRNTWSHSVPMNSLPICYIAHIC